MKYPFIAVLFVSLLLSPPIRPQKDAPLSVSLIQLIANPEKFDRKSVIVKGYLVITHGESAFQNAFLYFHEEDAENLLGNGLLVTLPDRMLRDQERIDRMYVILTGTILVTRDQNGVTSFGIDVQRCDPWSDPKHPRGLQGDTSKPTPKSKPSLKHDGSKPN
jgi:hypothetical protein